MSQENSKDKHVAKKKNKDKHVAKKTAKTNMWPKNKKRAKANM